MSTRQSSPKNSEVLTEDEMRELIEEMYRRGLLPKPTKEENNQSNLEQKDKTL